MRHPIAPFVPSSSGTFPGWLPGRFPAWLFVAAGVGVLICADPYLSALVPRRWWPAFAADLPWKLTALVAIVALVAYALARFASRFSASENVLILIAVGAQIGGLKAGIIGPLDVLTAVVMMALLADRLARPRAELCVALVVAAGGLLVLLALPHVVHQNPARYVIGLLALAKVVLLALVVINLVTSEERQRFFLKALLAVGVASALIGIAQSGLYLVWGRSFSVIEDFGAAGDTEIKDTLIGKTMRASALNATAQHLATFLVLLMPFLLYRLTEAQDRRAAWRYGLAALAFMAAVVLTWNHVSIAAMALVVVLFPLVRWPRLALHFLAFAALAAGMLYFTGILDWLYGIAFENHGSVSKGLFQRGVLFELALEKLGRDALVGEGLRSFAFFSGNYWHRPVHNAYLQAATELGLAGALVLFALLLVLATQLWHLARRGGSALPFARASLLSLLALMVLMLGEPMLDHSNTWLFLALYQCTILLAQRGRAASGAAIPSSFTRQMQRPT